MVNPQVAFKEWAAVSLAIKTRVQTVILRKGGIAEANGVFRPEYDQFWLYPTYFHEVQAEGIRKEFGHFLREAEDNKPAPGTVSLSTIIKVKQVEWIKTLDKAQSFTMQHILTPETVEKRFFYRQPGLYVLHIEAETTLTQVLPETPEYLGCKTWVIL